MGTLETFCRKHERPLFLLALLIFLANTLPGTNKFLILDELAYVKTSEAVLKTGFPLYEHNLFQPQYVGLWHPPLALFFYAVSFAFLGVSEFSARLVPLLFSAGTMLLTYLICKRVFRNSNKAELTGLLAILLYALNPFVVQNALLVDIDGGALTFFMTLFLYIFISPKGRFRRPALLLLFAAAMLTKLMSPLVGLAGIFLTSLYLSDRKSLTESILAGIAGILITVSFLYAYTWFFDKPDYFSMPFRHSLNKTGIFTNPTYLLQVLATAKTFFLYLTPPFAVIALLGFWHALLPLKKLKENKELAFCIAWALPILAVYTALGYMTWFFPKYFMPAMPVIAILAADYLLSLKLAPPKSRAIAITLATLAYAILVIRTPHFEIFKPDLLMNAVYPLLYSLPILVGYLLLSKTGIPAIKKIALASLLAFVPLSLYLNFILTTSNFSTAYMYGTTGVREAGAFFREHTQKEDVLLAPEDVSYYADRKYYVLISFDENRAAQLEDIIKNKKAKYITIYPYFLDEQAETLILSAYKYDGNIGSFPIYSPK